ncbi:MAG: hypothetical protein AB7H88_12740 [Vicinamibacterales bacterium]
MRTVLTLLAALAVCAAPAGALTLKPVSFSELVSGSVAIVYARVRAVEGHWTADRRRIESIVTADAVEYYKGSLGADVRFVLPGGEAGGMRMVLPGAPVLAPGDLVVLCLGADGPAMPRPVGLTQGIFRVAVDRRTGGLLVTPPPVVTAGRVVRGAPGRQPIPLAAFAASVREELEAAR